MTTPAESVSATADLVEDFARLKRVGVVKDGGS